MRSLADRTDPSQLGCATRFIPLARAPHDLEGSQDSHPTHGTQTTKATIITNTQQSSPFRFAPEQSLAALDLVDLDPLKKGISRSLVFARRSWYDLECLC
jgi:hypothetical protein